VDILQELPKTNIEMISRQSVILTCFTAIILILSATLGSVSAFVPSPLSQKRSNISSFRVGFKRYNNEKPSFVMAPLVAMSSKSAETPDVVIDPDFKAAALFVALGVPIIAINQAIPGYIIGGFFVLLGLLFAFQGTRVRFVFDETCFELKQGGDEEELKSSGKNFVVGGANRWTYTSFVNYDFFPSLTFPILVYFKETQTPSDKWEEGPGRLDKVGGGQIHFFPCICDAQQINEQFAVRGCTKVEE